MPLLVTVLLLGVWSLLEGLLSVHSLFMPILFFFVPGGTLIYYWKSRGLFLRDSSNWIFPSILAVAASLISVGAAVVPLEYLDKSASVWIIIGLSIVPVLSAVTLTELLVPQTLPQRWALKPAPAWILSGLLGWLSGVADWAVFWQHSPWFTIGGTAAAVTGSVLIYHRVVKPRPEASAFLAHFFGWMGLLVVVMLYTSILFHGHGIR